MDSTPSPIELVSRPFTAGHAIMWLIVLIALIAITLRILVRRRDCTAEINVIWFAFSLIFVIWWSLKLAMALHFIELRGAVSLPVSDSQPWTGAGHLMPW